MNRNVIIAALTAGALLAPAAGAVAKKPEAAKGKVKAEQVKAKVKAKKGKKPRKAKTVSYTLSGVYQGEGAVLVKKGNSAVRKAGLRGELLTLDFASAKITVDDVDGDGVAGIRDVQVGDVVLVQFRAPSALDEAATYKARKLVDRTHPPVEDEEEVVEDEDAPADDALTPADEPVVEDVPADGGAGDGE